MAMPPNTVVQMLRRLSGACSFPAPWERISCDEAFICLPTDLTALIDKLRRRFGDKELIKQGILEAAEPKPEVNSTLTANPNYVLAPLCGNQKGLIVAGQKSIDARRWSIVALLSNRSMEQLFRVVPARVFVTFSSVDLALLWSLGFAAIPSERLASIGGEELDELCQKLRLRRGATGREVAVGNSRTQKKPIFPIFVNWSPATLELADYAECRQAEQHFSELIRHLRLDLSGGGVWKPTAREIETLSFRLKHGSLTEVVEAVKASAEKSLLPFGAVKEAAPPSGKAYVAALEYWHQTARGTDDHRQTKAWDALQRQQTQAVILPLSKKVQTETDPLTRNLWAALSGVSTVFHRQAAFMSAKLNEQVRSHGFKISGQLPPADFQQLDVLTGHIIALSENLQSCNSLKNRKIGNPPAKTPPPDLKPSGSAPKTSQP